MTGDNAITRSTLGRFVLLGTLYFAQGLPFGFFVQALPVMLRKAGVSLSAIGFASLLALPWALKFLWAPIVDTRWLPALGRRRTWILSMQLAGVIVLGAISIVPRTDELAILMVAMFVLNLIAATQDIATDGLAVELLPPDERGFANGLQVAGYRAGMIVGGGVLLAAYAWLGHRMLFAIMAALTALSTIPVLAGREPPTIETATREPVRAPHFLSLPGAWRIIALVVAYKFGEAAAQGMMRPFLVDRGLDLPDIAWILGSVGFVAGALGAVVGGSVVGILGRKRALVTFGFGQVVSVLGYAYLAFGSPTYRELYIWAGVEHFASGMATAALFTAMMDWCRPAQSGTDYTVQASAQVIATFVASVFGGISADALGYGGHFIACAVFAALAIGVVWRLFPARFPSVG